ncbi:MAG: M48 family metalloprotease [Planctomycetota bacterium]|nr:M48 family metalloprotease [Planctomycetota bacterium]
MNASDPQARLRLDRIEAQARNQPWLHNARLFALVAIGYAGPLALLACSVAVVVALLAWGMTGASHLTFQEMLIYGGLVLGALILSALLLLSFFVSPPAPDEPELRAGEALPLRAMIDELRAARPTFPAIHHIHIDASLNAAVVQRTRFGFFGRKTNHLVVGLPLLLTLTPGQYQAVVAHELFHLDRAHGSFGAWVYRVYRTWATLNKPFATAGAAGGAMRRAFLRWYEPHLARSTIALRRLQECQADQCGAEIAGLDAMAGALVAMSWASYRLNLTFWPEVMRSAARDPIPPATIIERVADFLLADPPADAARRFRRYEFARRTPLGSDHPCLADRLQSLKRLTALGEAEFAGHPLPRGAADAPPAPALALPDSAMILLADARRRATDLVNATWKAAVIGRFRHEHALAKQHAKPDEAALSQAATPADAEWRAASPEIDLATVDQAILLAAAFLERHPAHPPASYTLGSLLLVQQDDAAAVPHIEAAIRGDSDLIGPGLAILLDYYRMAGRDDEAEPIRRRLEAHGQSLDLARKERLTVTRRDALEPHGLPRAEVERVRRVVSLYPQVKAVYLARKRVKLFADKPCYVLGVARTGGMLGEERDKYLVNGLQAQVPLPCAVVVLTLRNARIKSRLLAACPDPIFEG